jgi:hypothetical protein
MPVMTTITLTTVEMPVVTGTLTSTSMMQVTSVTFQLIM